MTTFIKRLSITLVLFVVSIWALLFLLPTPPLLTGIRFSEAVYDERMHLLRLTLSEDAKYRLYTPLADISPEIIAATLLEEDQYYYQHIGINPVALMKAAWHTYITHSRRMGGSTISMQVARLRYRINSKSLSGKLLQAMRALQLERHYSKDQLLEAYLNLAPYGNNVEGVGAASLIYFGKSAQRLSLPEALTLAVIPQNPTKRLPDKDILKRMRNRLFTRWVRQHPADRSKQAMFELPLEMRSKHNIPFLSPHFVDQVLASKIRQHGNVVTTLDLRLQHVVERVTKHYLVRKNNLGVTNAAVLVVDTRDMSIKAMLGSADFFNASISGQINGTDIKRSPGSTLKPFIYALALDQGLIHPATVLKDVPRSFGSYNPENFDYDFVGPIKAKDALLQSRNIPAVYLADQLNHPSLYEFLKQAGVKNLKSASYYGLALVLGGAEVSMTELLTMYATLANDGIWKPLQSVKSQIPIQSKRLMSAEAAYLVLDMLRDNQLAGSDLGISHSQALSIAWKTGTSSAYRDAWTVGVFGPYVMGVWIGHFDNRSNPAFIGKELAAPLFFEIANAIHLQLGALPQSRKHTEGLNLQKIDVCNASGMLPTRYCTDTAKVWFIPGKSPIKTDTIFREVAIDKQTGLRTCHFDQNTKFEIYEFWTSDLLKIFKRAGMQRRIPPAFDPTCNLGSNTDTGFIPQLISPQTQVNYVARVDSIKKTIIPFTAVVDADVRNLHWFLNERFIGKTKRDQSFLWHATPGKYVVRVVDDYGRSDVRDIKVMLER